MTMSVMTEVSFRRRMIESFKNQHPNWKTNPAKMNLRVRIKPNDGDLGTLMHQMLTTHYKGEKFKEKFKPKGDEKIHVYCIRINQIGKREIQRDRHKGAPNLEVSVIMRRPNGDVNEESWSWIKSLQTLRIRKTTATNVPLPTFGLEYKQLDECMRSAIKTQTHAFKTDSREDCPPHWTCALCKCDLNDIKHAQTDHKDHAFAHIKRYFLKTQEKPNACCSSYTKLQVCKKEGDPRYHFDTTCKDTELFNERWCKYHQEMATYQILCFQCNGHKGTRT